MGRGCESGQREVATKLRVSGHGFQVRGEADPLNSERAGATDGGADMRCGGGEGRERESVA